MRCLFDVIIPDSIALLYSYFLNYFAGIYDFVSISVPFLFIYNYISAWSDPISLGSVTFLALVNLSFVNM